MTEPLDRRIRRIPARFLRNLGKFRQNLATLRQNLAFKIRNDGSFRVLASNYDQFLSNAIASHPEYSRPGYITKDTMGLFSIVGDMFGKKYREAGYFGGGEDY